MRVLEGSGAAGSAQSSNEIHFNSDWAADGETRAQTGYRATAGATWTHSTVMRLDKTLGGLDNACLWLMERTENPPITPWGGTSSVRSELLTTSALSVSTFTQLTTDGKRVFGVFNKKNCSVCLFHVSVKPCHDLLINCKVIVTAFQHQDAKKKSHHTNVLLEAMVSHIQKLLFFNDRCWFTFIQVKDALKIKL